MSKLVAIASFLNNQLLLLLKESTKKRSILLIYLSLRLEQELPSLFMHPREILFASPPGTRAVGSGSSHHIQP